MTKKSLEGSSRDGSKIGSKLVKHVSMCFLQIELVNVLKNYKIREKEFWDFGILTKRVLTAKIF